MIKLPPLDLYAGATADRNNTNFPIRANGLTYVDTEADVLYVYASGAWHGLGAPGIPEPPDDAETYGRKTDTTSSWVAVLPKEGGWISNDVGADVDHRIETSGNPNMLFINGGNNRVGVGGDPDLLFEVIGDGGQAIAAVSSYENATSGSQLVARKARGSKGTPTAIQSNDTIGLYPFQGHDGSAFAAGAAIVVIANQTWTGSAHGARMDFRTVSDASTTLSIRMRLYEGLQVGSPTGGDKGAGTINAQAIYDDNVLVSDHIFDLHYDGRMMPSDAERFPNARLWNIEQTAVFTKKNRHLPTMPGRLQWETTGGDSLGRLITALWETVEQQQLMIFELDKRLKAVKNGR